MELNAHHSLQKRLLPVPGLKQMTLLSPFHLTSLKIYFNIFSRLCLDLTKWSLIFTFSYLNTVCISLLPRTYMWSLIRFILLDFIVIRMLDEYKL